MSNEDQPFAVNERRLALVIGVNEAPQSHLAPLNYALNDAESMAQTLQDDCGFTLLKPPLLDAEATSANVKKAVLALARERSDNDFLLLYFSGHGQPMTVGGDQSDIYLVTSDFSETDTEEDETLHCSMRWLQDKLYLPTQAGKVLLVVDCCYAGNMGRTASDPYLEDLKMRINKYFGAPGAASGARSGGLRLALTATGHNQPAGEQEGHGAMTGQLLECLQGKIDDVIDLDDRGNVSLQRLHDYLLRVMPKDQNPSVSGDYAGQNCILANYAQRAIELRQRKRALVNEIPHSYLPMARSTSFQQRPGEFDKIVRLLLADEGNKASAQARIVGLIGMGGIGKTRLAVEIAYEYKEHFAAGIFWMAATGTNLSEWQHQFAELAANTDYLPPRDDVSHPENEARRARHIVRFLAHHSDALLLLDNVERIEHLLDALTTFAGEEVQCAILYTSRTGVAPTSVKKYPVSKLPDEGALRLLLEHRPTLLERIIAGADDQETKAARAICQYVDGLPLALILLRDLLQDTHLTLTHLDRQLKERGALDITREQDVTDTRLFSTFLLSWQNVRNPDAKRLFKLASFFPEATPIPLWLLALAANLEGNTSIDPLGRARIELVRWSLIEELPSDALRLHPIIREFARYLVTQDNERDALLPAAQVHLTNEFTDVNRLEQRVLAEGYWRCLEHVHEAVNYAQRLGIKLENLLERVEYWLARDSSLLGAGALWPEVLPGLFYQQLHNRALEEGYQLPGTEPDARWVRQSSRVGAEDQSLLREFRHPGGVTCVAFSPDSRLVATGCEDHSVRLWDVGNGQMVQMLQGHNSPITGVTFSPDGSMIATCSLDMDASLWNARNGHIIRAFYGHKAGLRNVIFSPDGKYVATRSDDRTVRVWEVATGEMVAVLVGGNSWMQGIKFSPDSRQIAICSSIGITIWDRDNEQLVATLGSEQIGLTEIYDGIEFSDPVFFPDGKSLLFASVHGIYTWHIGQQEVLAPIYGGFFWDFLTSRAAFSSNGSNIALINNNMVKVLSIQDMEVLLSCGHNTTISNVAFSLDSSKILTGSSDGTARIWKISPVLTAKVALPSHDEEIVHAIFSSSDIHLILLTRQCFVHVWNVTNGELVRNLRIKDPDWENCVALSSDGKRVIGLGMFNEIRIWDIEQKQDITQHILLGLPLSGPLSCIVFSLNVMNVAIAVHQGIQVWSLDTWKEIALLHGHEGDIKQMTFSPDGTRLVTGSTDATARIWNISSGAQLAVLKNYAGRSIGISLDGRMLAAGLFSNAVYIASMENGARLMIAEGHTQPVTILSFSPAGRFLLSADQSGVVMFWRVEVDGQMKKTPMGIYLAANEIAAVHWYDEQHVILADLGGMQNHPHFYHLALEGEW